MSHGVGTYLVYNAGQDSSPIDVSLMDVRYGFAGVADKTGHIINIFDRSREVSITQRRLKQELLLTSSRKKIF